MTGPQTFQDDDRLEAALAWHVRIDGDVPEDAWLAFVEWLEVDPRNRLAFDKVDAMSKTITAQLSSAPIEQASNVAVLRRAQGSMAFLKRAWVPGAVAAAVLVAVFFQVVGSSGTQTFSTAVGEHRDVTLDDGSVIHLNTNTALSVSMSRDVRNVSLQRGEAEFEVTADAQRPFRVEMGARRIEVVGTEFNVLRHDGRQTVAVEHGIVQVSLGGDAVRLSAGEQYLSREGSAEYQVIKISPAAIAPWREGQLVFEDVPLSQVAADLNRYFTRTIVIDDAAVRDLRFSGILKIDNELAVARRLEAFLPIAVQVKGNELVLTRGPSK